MAKFNEYIKQCREITLDAIENAARQALPRQYRARPWELTNKGGSDASRTIYTYELQLDAYLASYVEWHKGKLKRAFRLLDSPLPRQINIIDWGCGQGVATLFVLDFIRQNSLPCSINEVILIEPSAIALKRAEYLIGLSDAGIKIKVINKKIDAVTKQELKFKNQLPVYQLFSNIIDIGGFDLKELTRKIYANSSSINTLICVSPFYYAGNIRIDSFFKYFQRPLVFEKHEMQSNKLVCGYTYNIGLARLLPDEARQIVEYKFYPAVQFRAAYELSAVQDMAEFPERLTYFDVYAPFDFGANISDGPHPIFAVLNNIITRGLATYPSPFVEREFCKANNFIDETSGNGVIQFVAGRRCCHCVYGNLVRALENRNELRFGEFMPQNEVAYSPLAIARIQKLIVEILVSNKLSLDLPEWNVLVEEKDVPCAALAFEDFRQMFNTLTSMSVEYESMTLPEIKLTIISNEQYNDSPLHLNEYHVEHATDEIKAVEYDLVIHYSSTEKAGEYDFSKYKAKNDCYFAIFSASEDELQAERYVYTTDRISYKPFVTKNRRGYFIEDDEQVEKLTYFLNLLFRKEKFRNGQLPILTRALSIKPVIGLLPTGSGKSLTYQLAALLQPGITVVIDPLVSLMKDQYDGLRRNGIDNCTYINATVVNKDEREEMMERSKVQFVFLSPERLCIMKFRSRLRNMQDLHVYFSYGVIDEVHCVSEWGHDFRFTYLHLGRNLYQYILPKQGKDGASRLSLFGLTATASFDVLSDVERELSGNGAFPIDGDATIRYENTNRLELQYLVVPVDGTACMDKWGVYKKKNDMIASVVEQSCARLRELQQPENIQRIKKRFIERESIDDEKILQEIKRADLHIEVDENWYSEEPNRAAAIVFCPHRQGRIGVNDTSKNIGIATALGMKFGRNRISKYVGGDILTEQERFIACKTSMMVATKAFGMGIDKPNVRFTFNVNFSGSLEAFVQEAGRAGRDRKMALATILYCPKKFLEQNPRTRFMEQVPVDYGVHKFFFDNNFISEKFERTVMYYLLTQSVIDIADEVVVESGNVQSKQVSGFMNELLHTKVGEQLVSYISYSPEVNAGSVSIINGWLQQMGLPVLVFKDPREVKEGEVEFVAAIEKAIYRMCCVGIIDDYTRDYSIQQFRIVTQRKSDDDYFAHLKRYLERYFSSERADAEIQKAYKCIGDNAMMKCLTYITRFVYSQIAAKRKKAIQDMEAFCSRAVNSGKDWLRTNEDLKDDIYYYFNSKFAREDYVTEDGRPYSLVKDTNYGKDSSYNVLFKYLNVIDDDVVGASGSPIDNIRHLYGAVRLIRRSLTDTNPTLDFLNVYCLLYLNIQSNEVLRQELRDSFVNGYKEFKNRTDDCDEFYEMMELFIQKLREKNAITQDNLAELEMLQQISEAESQLDWLSKFKKLYVTD